MTDDTIEQIGEASKAFADKHFASHGTYYDRETSFRAGATHQHPISFEQGRKEGWNEAISSIVSEKYVMMKRSARLRDDYPRGSNEWLYFDSEFRNFENEMKHFESLKK